MAIHQSCWDKGDSPGWADRAFAVGHKTSLHWGAAVESFRRVTG